MKNTNSKKPGKKITGHEKRYQTGSPEIDGPALETLVQITDGPGAGKKGYVKWSDTKNRIARVEFRNETEYIDDKGVHQHPGVVASFDALNPIRK